MTQSGDLWIKTLLRRARRFSKLAARGPQAPWKVSWQGVGLSTMIELNGQFRKRWEKTDVLSFPSPRVFYEQGFLGEIVVCIPVMKSQRFGGSLEKRLHILLTHGVLHLLGLDHELGPKQAQEMAFWEQTFLGQPGLLLKSSACSQKKK